MNSTGETPNRIVYFHNMMILLADCLRVNSSTSQLRCVTAKLAGIACSCLLPLIIVFGLLGNSFVGYAMLVKIRPLTRQNAYIGCTALVDMVTMTMFGLVNFYLSRGLPWLSGGSAGYIMQNDGYLGCKIYLAVITVCPLLPASLLLVMVADRGMSFLAPFRFRTLGPKFAFKAMSAAAIASLLLSVPSVLVGARHSYPLPGGFSIVVCFIREEYEMVLLYWSLICNPPTIFLAGILLLNLGLLFFILRLAQERKKNLGINENSVSGGMGSAGQNLSGAVIVLLLAVVKLTAQLPTVALYWALEVHSKAESNKTDDTTRVMVNLLAVIGSLALAGQCGSFPILMRRNPRFREYFSNLMASLVPNRRPNAANHVTADRA